MKKAREYYFDTQKIHLHSHQLACEQAYKWSGVKSRAWPGGGKKSFSPPGRASLAASPLHLRACSQAITPVDAYHSIPIVYLQVVDLHINSSTGGAILRGTFLINYPIGCSLHLTRPIHKMLWLVDVIKCWKINVTFRFHSNGRIYSGGRQERTVMLLSKDQKGKVVFKGWSQLQEKKTENIEKRSCLQRNAFLYALLSNNAKTFRSYYILFVEFQCQL